MKIAISIPDSVFREVKKLAEEQKRSRSEVIVEAVSLYLKDLESRRMMDSPQRSLLRRRKRRRNAKPERSRPRTLRAYVLEKEREW